MKKIMIASVIAMVMFSGCDVSPKYSSVKKAFGDIKYDKCQKIVDSVPDDRGMNKDAIVLMALVVSNCENTQEILAEIKTLKQEGK